MSSVGTKSTESLPSYLRMAVNNEGEEKNNRGYKRRHHHSRKTQTRDKESHGSYETTHCLSDGEESESTKLTFPLQDCGERPRSQVERHLGCLELKEERELGVAEVVIHRQGDSDKGDASSTSGKEPK